MATKRDRTEYFREYQRKNRKRLNAYYRARERRLWTAAIAAYGNKCICCGEPELRFLTLDHVEGRRPEFPDLKRHKGKNRPPTHVLYLWLQRRGWPEGYQVLCWNCNQATRWGDSCPHTTR